VKALAIDIGGTHAACALVEDRRIIVSETLDADGVDLAPLLRELGDRLRDLLGRAGVPAPACAGVAVAFCGIVDPQRARILATRGKYADAPQLDLQAWARHALGLPVAVENDARMALLGEWYAGAARGVNNVVMITLGTGVGGAAMINGRLLHGKHYQAGCLGGHLPALFTGRRCICGAIGCVEAEASTWALPAICRETPGFDASPLSQCDPVTFEDLFRYARAGDQVAETVRTRCLKVWGTAAVALIHAYDPEVVLFGGGVMKSAPDILPSIKAHVSECAWTPWGEPEVRAAELGNEAALLGAIPMLGGPRRPQ